MPKIVDRFVGRIDASRIETLVQALVNNQPASRISSLVIYDGVHAHPVVNFSQ